MFLNKIRNIFCVPDTKFVSATNVARTGKRGNICVGNNVSATMSPRLPGPSLFNAIGLFGRRKMHANNRACDITVLGERAGKSTTRKIR